MNNHLALNNHLQNEYTHKSIERYYHAKTNIENIHRKANKTERNKNLYRALARSALKSATKLLGQHNVALDFSCIYMHNITNSVKK